jgi:protein SCO1/2
MDMRFRWCFSLLLAAAAVACSSSPRSDSQTKTYALHGQVIAIDAATKNATIKHGDIKDFMSAMTMPYPVKDMSVLKGIAPGDVIDATLTVGSSGIFLTDVKKVGTAPLEKPPAQTSDASPSASSGFELIKVGDPAPNAPFVDQNGRTRDFASFKGQTVVLTFIYTKCPMPTFCPLMDRNFAAIQKTMEGDPSLKNVHLVSVSFDPITDTPPVLKKHAAELGADAKRWTFLTGDRDEIDRFAARFGVSVARAETNPLEITHNLRTAIIDADGRLQKVYTGNEWTPQQLLADLKPIAAAAE